MNRTKVFVAILTLALLAGNAMALERRRIPPADLQAPAAVKAEAGPLAEAFAAYYCGDYGRAAQIWQPLAEAGNGGADKNEAQALEWFQKAAAAGDPRASQFIKLMKDKTP